ncbi:MAG TPA: glycosyl hydrolase 53 family protein [Ideonella sp.]|uniref:glycoside hydrolase family 53 protein n=1 Tax=Ideonella sp. TaxID=1929293 RepID=UPI002C177F7B|nr:glycosyl hydrolase 53 family protein [Ideonella sp.]HSI50074.1 glycosyl hydrolase 53 family protein [Ideonella sp.]
MTTRNPLSRLGRILVTLCLLAPLIAQAVEFARGADISSVTEQEAAGRVFRDVQGKPEDPFVLLKGLGVNAVRLRVWVQPKTPWCDLEDTLRKARRAQGQGQRVMIDFHYSDTWAGLHHQTPPAAWSDHRLAELRQDVAQHTRRVLTALKEQGIQVHWVQVGNEINAGMLWPKGQVQGKQADYEELAKLINAGYDSVKEVYPQAQVVVHLAGGGRAEVLREFLDGVQSAGGRWDVLGVSHYPDPARWMGDNQQLRRSLGEAVRRYGKPVMVVETGMNWQQPAVSQAMLKDVIQDLRALGDKGAGIFYWEPATFPDWSKYQRGALDTRGRFTSALEAY